MIKIIDKITVILWRWTHRIKKTNWVRGHQLTTKIYAPQWWFLWWHYYWYVIGYHAVVPETFDTMAAAYDFVTPYWMPDRECKLEFYRKQDEINKKLDEANKDF